MKYGVPMLASLFGAMEAARVQELSSVAALEEVIVPAPTEPTVKQRVAIEVSCWRNGVFNDGKRSGSLDWGKIVSGNFETLWIPMPFVRGLAPGKARTLLPCSDWRWQLQHPGY